MSEETSAGGEPLRRVSPIKVGRAGGTGEGESLPVFEWVDPEVLLINESYQRTLSRRSIELIRKIVAGWDWSRFKPPIVARGEYGYEIVDGQHTAIAAASHPRVRRIPVMIIDAARTENRAAAFIGHNRDRVAITPLQIHNASCAAGETQARALQMICSRVGIALLHSMPADGRYRPGETVAVATIQRLLSRQGDARALQVLEIAARAQLAPVGASAIRAIELLLYDDHFGGAIELEEIEAVLREGLEPLKAEARLFSATHNVPLWRALGSVIFQKAKKGRRRGGLPSSRPHPKLALVKS